MEKIRLTDIKPVDEKVVDELGAAQKRRLERIDLHLAWDGSFGRSDISRFFDISDQQASADIAKYREIAPENSRYDTKDKTYYATDSFEPALVKLSADRYLHQLQALHSNVIDTDQTWFREAPSFDAVPHFEPDVSNEVLMKILKAIRLSYGMKIKYQPLTRPEFSTKWIAPHAIAFNGRRWHVRAWSFDREEFRDFVLTRIRDVSEFSDIKLEKGNSRIGDTDSEWNETVDIKIIPCKGLPTSQKRVIAKDYGMKVSGSKITGKKVKIRKSLVFYFVDWYRLDPEWYGHIPEKIRMIEIENWAEVEPFMPRRVGTS